jgi:hypothetical protein
MAEDIQHPEEPRGQVEPRPPEELAHPNGRVEHPEVRHETSDINFRWIAGILVGAVILGVIVQFSVWLFFRDYRRYQSDIKKSPYPLAATPSEALPAEPRLEQLERLSGVEKANVFKTEAARLSFLNSYGATPDRGYVHIPIDRAMKLVEKQLASRPEKRAGDKRANGLVDAGEPNSGRMFRGKPKWGKD